MISIRGTKPNGDEWFQMDRKSFGCRRRRKIFWNIVSWQRLQNHVSNMVSGEALSRNFESTLGEREIEIEGFSLAFFFFISESILLVNDSRQSFVEFKFFLLLLSNISCLCIARTTVLASILPFKRQDRNFQKLVWILGIGDNFYREIFFFAAKRINLCFCSSSNGSLLAIRICVWRRGSDGKTCKIISGGNHDEHSGNREDCEWNRRVIVCFNC